MIEKKKKRVLAHRFWSNQKTYNSGQTEQLLSQLICYKLRVYGEKYNPAFSQLSPNISPADKGPLSSHLIHVINGPGIRPGNASTGSSLRLKLATMGAKIQVSTFLQGFTVPLLNISKK